MAILLYPCWIALFVCQILVIVKMIQNGQTVLGIIGIFCGIIPLIVGWQNVEKWSIKNLMMAFTALFVLTIVLEVVVIMSAMHH